MDPSQEMEDEERTGAGEPFDASRGSLPRPRSSLGLSVLQSNAMASGMPPMVTPSSTRSSLSSQYHDDFVFMPPHRPMVGGGAAAAFEALRHDFYVRRHEQRLQAQQNSEQTSGLENPFLYPDQFEMLRMHHYNLVHEIQETSSILSSFQHHETPLRDAHPPPASERFASVGRSNSAGAKRRSSDDRQIPTSKRHKSLDD